MRSKYTFVSTRIFSFCCIVVLGSSLARAQSNNTVSKVGTVAASFLEIDVGARAVGMGGAFVAVADDATAIFWNPAGLSRLESSEAIIIHTNWLVSTYFDFAGFVTPLGRWGTVAASITSLSTDEMDVRTIQFQEGTGERFSYSDLSLALSYAKNLTSRLSIGVNAKYISQRIWHMSSAGYAFDIGTLFRTQFNDLTIGMSISNFGTSMRLEGKDTFVNYDEAPQFGGSNDRIPAFKQTDKFPLPLIFRVGLSMDIIRSDANQLLLAIDAAHPNDNTEFINVGMEYVFKDKLALRLGYKNVFTLDTEEGFTAGAGTKFNLVGGVVLSVDYSYQDFGLLNYVQRFSLGFSF